MKATSSRYHHYQPIEQHVVGQEKEHEDGFKPRKSRFAERVFRSLLHSDDDIWVERYYLNTKRRRVYFYRSFKTGKCVTSEPPSGACHIVRIRDLDQAPPYIQQFAQEQLDRGMYSSKMERSRPTLYPSNPKKAGFPRLFK